jgi:hypothetical protein
LRVYGLRVYGFHVYGYGLSVYGYGLTDYGLRVYGLTYNPHVSCVAPRHKQNPWAHHAASILIKHLSRHAHTPSACYGEHIPKPRARAPARIPYALPPMLARREVEKARPSCRGSGRPSLPRRRGHFLREHERWHADAGGKIQSSTAHYPQYAPVNMPSRRNATT